MWLSSKYFIWQDLIQISHTTLNSIKYFLSKYYEGTDYLETEN